MNGKELLQSMSEIENDLIIQSEFEFHQKKKIIHVKRRIAIAACLRKKTSLIRKRISGRNMY